MTSIALYANKYTSTPLVSILTCQPLYTNFNFQAQFMQHSSCILTIKQIKLEAKHYSEAILAAYVPVSIKDHK
jgi:hypothetical protein